MSGPQKSERRPNPWTHVLVAVCAAFIFTVFLMVAAAFNGQAAGLGRFFDRHGILVLGIEVGVILGLTVVVIAVERRETLRRIEERERSLLSNEKDDARREGVENATADAQKSPSEEPR